MPEAVVDLRSDTVTRPTPAMREAMARASVGDDVFEDDPSVNALQERMASLTGHEASLLMASGTQSNLCALLAHCGRGDEYLVGQHAHCYRYEGGGAAVLGGIQPQPLPQDAAGRLALADILQAIKPDDAHFARTRLLCLENTWNGHPQPPPGLAQAVEGVRARGLASHLDGARVFNAAAHEAGPGGDVWAALRGITARFDSVSVCASKGLGAPVGSLLCGSRSFIAQARRWRKVVGGGMRQAGLLAAAISYALDHHVHRLHEDHRRAARLAQALADVPGLSIRSAATNIVFVDVPDERGPALLSFLESRGILATGLLGLRFVTHLDIDDEAIERTVRVVREGLSAPAPATPAQRVPGPYR